MKGEKRVYFLNVNKHRWVCAFCPDYLPAGLARAFKIYTGNQKELYDIMRRLLSLFAPYDGGAKSIEKN